MTSDGAPTRRALLVLVNPVAGGKPAAGGPPTQESEQLEPEAIADALRAHGLAVELRILTAADDVFQMARAAADDHDVVVAGGDGTVGPAGYALVGSSATLGILARGSFNNVARGLGISDRLEPALDAIARGDVVRVDVGMAERDGIDPEPFLEAGGIGLDAMGFGAVELAERRGMWRGIRFLWRALRRVRVSMELSLDGREVVTSAPSVVVCNGPYHGAGFAIAPDADPTDGLLDVAVFSRMGRLQALVHYLRVARGRRVRDPRIRIERAAEIRVGTRHGVLPVQVDGRSIGATPVSFTVRQAALRIFR
jgi:diacylglycerol kinase family enzyme